MGHLCSRGVDTGYVHDRSVVPATPALPCRSRIRKHDQHFSPSKEKHQQLPSVPITRRGEGYALERPVAPGTPPMLPLRPRTEKPEKQRSRPPVTASTRHVDGDTEVPSDLYFDMLRLADRRKVSGVHTLKKKKAPGSSTWELHLVKTSTLPRPRVSKKHLIHSGEGAEEEFHIPDECGEVHL